MINSVNRNITPGHFILLPALVIFTLVLTNTVSAYPMSSPAGNNTVHKIGIYQNGVWYLDDNGNGMWDAGIDSVYSFGGSGWISVMGDWNGESNDTMIGVYRDGIWYLDVNGNGIWDAGIDKMYTFGAPGWTPVTGDWNGDNRTKIGIYKEGTWFLDFNGNGVWEAGTDKVYTFGAPGWTSVLGDWNGDGDGIRIGVYRDGVWYLDVNGNGAWDAGIDKMYTFGAPGWTSVSGDWNADGKRKTGIYKEGTWYLDFNGNGIWEAGADKVYTFGAPGWTSVSGDWNGDGNGIRIGVYRDGVWYLDINGNGAWDAGTDNVNSFGTSGYTAIVGNWIGGVPVASFTTDVRNGTSPVTVSFFDKSTGSDPMSYEWDINNDGIVDYSIKNPVHTYQSAGTYSVRLTVTNDHGSDSEIKTNYITVQEECFGAEACNPTGNPIGGGAGYTEIIAETDARVKYVVSTKEQLLTALRSAKTGEVVYVLGDADINLTGTYGVTVPAGVTLASNRGKDGSSGGRIFQNRIPTDPTYEQITSANCTLLKAGGDNVRITGLRLEGPDKTTADLKSMNLGMKNGIGIWNYSLLEVDNCEIWGWGWAGVALRIASGTDNAYVHHNYIHHCQDSNVGYGVAVTGGTAVVEANLFDYTKHAVTGSGFMGEGYEARYNVHLAHANAQVFDVHPYTNPADGQIYAGDTYRIHHNTILVTQSVSAGIRAVPVQGVWINHNRFQWYNNNGRNEPPVYQSGGTGRVYMTQNLIGPDQVLYQEGPLMLL